MWFVISLMYDTIFQDYEDFSNLAYLFVIRIPISLFFGIKIFLLYFDLHYWSIFLFIAKIIDDICYSGITTKIDIIFKINSVFFSFFQYTKIQSVIIIYSLYSVLMYSVKIINASDAMYYLKWLFYYNATHTAGNSSVNIKFIIIYIKPTGFYNYLKTNRAVLYQMYWHWLTKYKIGWQTI